MTKALVRDSFLEKTIFGQSFWANSYGVLSSRNKQIKRLMSICNTTEGNIVMVILILLVFNIIQTMHFSAFRFNF